MSKTVETMQNELAGYREWYASLESVQKDAGILVSGLRRLIADAPTNAEAVDLAHILPHADQVHRVLSRMKSGAGGSCAGLEDRLQEMEHQAKEEGQTP